VRQFAILCIDDDETILNALEVQIKKVFKDRFIIELAQNAKDAIDILDELEEENIELSIIISDWLMPGMKGDELLILVHKKFPNAVKIMLSGQADKLAIEKAKKEAEIVKFINKPWNSQELIELIKDNI